MSLHSAASKGDIAEVERLLAAGANRAASPFHIPEMESEDWALRTPLLRAAMEGHVEVVKRLLAAGAKMETFDRAAQTPLIAAAKNGHTEVVEILLAAGANKEAGADYGQGTSLSYAVSEGHTEVVKRLLAAGANKDRHMLISAISRGHTEILKLLIADGANVNFVNTDKQSLLHIATDSGFEDIVEVLLAAGVNKDATDIYGQTPLHIAARDGNKYIVELLLAAGADINKVDNDGQTAKQVAAVYGQYAIVKLLSPSSGQKWKGFSRSDIENLNSIFETESVGGDPPRSINTSCCPVCFQVVAPGRASQFEVTRSAACRYITHNCSTAGGHYHRELYEKYKSPEGDIQWCTVCGRICTAHAHHKLALANEPKAGLLPKGPSSFDNVIIRDATGRPVLNETTGRSKTRLDADGACKADGGGGLLEKLARYRRLREFALSLQTKVDKISFEDALEGLIEETWNAPSRKLDLAKMMEAKKFNIPATNFPVYRNNGGVAPEVPWPFSGRPDMMPIMEPGFTEEALKAIQEARAAEGANIAAIESNIRNAHVPAAARALMAPDAANYNTNIMMNELVMAIKLKHRQSDGSTKIHPGITIETLFEALGTFGVAGSPEFGNCFLNEADNRCSGLHYPGELKYILDNYHHESLTDDMRRNYQQKLDKYTTQFNEEYRRTAAFKARVEADKVGAAAVPMGGAGGQGGGRRTKNMLIKKHRTLKVRRN